MKLLRNLARLTLAATTVICSTSTMAVTVDILALYDSRVPSLYNGDFRTVLESRIDAANSYLRASNVDIQYEIIGYQTNDFASGTGVGQALHSIFNSQKIKALREKYGADIVMQFVYDRGEEGVALFAVDPEQAYAAVGARGTGFVVAHEAGHTMGLSHSRAQGDSGGAKYAYGLGHGVSNQFGTIMTYYWLFGNGSVNANKFSSPLLTCPGGNPCGIAAGQPNQADAALALNNTKNIAAAYRPRRMVDPGGPVRPTTPDTPLSPPGTFRLQSKDSGLFLSSSIFPSWYNTVRQRSRSLFAITSINVQSSKTAGRYLLAFGTTGYCAGVNSTAVAVNSPIIAVPCGDVANQQVSMTKVSDNFYTISFTTGGKCAAASGGLKTDGTPIVQDACNNAAFQTWKLVKP